MDNGIESVALQIDIINKFYLKREINMNDKENITDSVSSDLYFLRQNRTRFVCLQKYEYN